MKSSDAATPRAGKVFSKTVAVTYAALGLFSTIFVASSFRAVYVGVISRSPSLMLYGAVLLSFGISCAYVIVALRQRVHWSRIAALGFWLLGMIWTILKIVRNGLHPEPPPGPLAYANAGQLAGARFSTLVFPYLLALLESSAIYGLLLKTSVIDQFKRLDS